MASPTVTLLPHEAYLRSLRADVERLSDLAARIAPDTPVPTRPGRRLEDLLSRVRETLDAAAQPPRGAAGASPAAAAPATATLPAGAPATAEALATEPATATPPTSEPASPEVPAGAPVDLVAAVRSAGARAVDTLARAATTASEPNAARRLAHTLCMSRLDVELTAAPDGSARTPIDSELATDGVDEVLRVLIPAEEAAGGAPVVPRPGRTVRLVATDTGATWLLTLADRVAPSSEPRPSCAPTIYVAGADPVDGTVRPVGILSGTAQDLYCRLWGRPVVTEPHRTGDLALLAEIDGALDPQRRTGAGALAATSGAR